jgi:troponin T
MQKRKLGDIGGLDEDAQALLAANAEERAAMEAEIRELRERNERRKREREEEEKRLAERRAEEEARRKAEEEERRRKKEEEDASKKAARAAKMEQFEKLKNPPKPNFVISKRGDGTMAVEGEEEEQVGEKKSKEQLEAEKQAILQQRIPAKPDVANMDEAKLAEKAKELFKELTRLEGEKYDLEKRFKEQQRDMMELAERARNINKVGKGGLKRQQLDDEDAMASKFAGIPAKIQMYSKYERQKDKRNFGARHEVFHGPTWRFPAEKVKPTRTVKFNPDTGLPEYEEIEGAEAAAEEAGEGEE